MIAPVTQTVIAQPFIAPSVISMMEDLNQPDKIDTETKEDENHITLAYIKSIG